MFEEYDPFAGLEPVERNAAIVRMLDVLDLLKNELKCKLVRVDAPSPAPDPCYWTAAEVEQQRKDSIVLLMASRAKQRERLEESRNQPSASLQWQR